MIEQFKTRWMPSRKRSWIGLAAVTLVGLPLLFLWDSTGSAKPEVGIEPRAPVAAATVQREDLWREQAFDAEFRPYQEIDLHAKVTGFLEKITVDIGDQVKAGQLLATLEIPELADDLTHAQAVEKRSLDEVKRAQAAYEEAHLICTRLMSVDKAQPNLVAQQDIDAAKSKDQAAEANLAAAREQVEVARADIKKLMTMLKYSQIAAPFDGVITQRYLDPGALVQGGTASTRPLVRLSQNDRLRLDFPASLSFVSAVKKGAPVEVQVPSLGKTYHGTISRSTRRIDFETRTMEVEVDVPNPDLSLIPGMYASAVVRVDRKPQALAVPVEAVSGQQRPTVFVIGKDGTVQERTITVGLETPGKWEVLSGLKENDLVLIGSRAQIRPGQKVTPKLLGETLHAMK